MTTNNAPARNMEPCTRCNKRSTQNCPGCNGISYCSTRCQTDDRKVHELVCSPNSELLSPPCHNTVRAFFFPEDRSTFEIVRLPYEVNDETKKHMLDFETFKEFLSIPSSNGALYTFPAREQMTTQFPRHDLYIYCRPSFLYDGSRPNESIRAVTLGRMRNSWIGPMIIAAESRSYPDRLEDVTMHDFGCAVAYLQNYSYM